MVELPIVAFKTRIEWRDWLEKNQGGEIGVWLQFFKKNSQKESISYIEAVEEALCFGWIDSQVKKYDEKSYLQKFTPRRSKSIWSKINTERIERLTKEQKMRPSGIKEVEDAKKDGRWIIAYDSPSNVVIPPDFIQELSGNEKAKQFFNELNKSNIYAITWRLQTAKKPETRIKRMKTIIEMLSKREKFH